MATETTSTATEPEPPPESGSKGFSTSARSSAATMFRSIGRGARRLLTSLRPWLAVLSVIVLLYIFWTPIKNLYWLVFPPEGSIYVDSPEVYTRERLINERLNEEAWLDQQLADAAANDDFTSIENVIRQKLSLDLDEGEASGQGEAEAKGSSLIGFNDKFRLRSASRSLIRQRIIENKLDDRHDLEGNALYVLKFDNTVISAPASGRMAQVRIEILPPDGVDDAAVYLDSDDSLSPPFLSAIRGRSGYRFESVYNIWKKSIDDRINNRIRTLYNRFLLEKLTSSALLDIANYTNIPAQRSGSLQTMSELQDYSGNIDYLLKSVPEDEQEDYILRIKAYFARKAVAEVLGVAEDEIEIDLSSAYDPFKEYPIVSESVPDALGLTVRITKEETEAVARPLVQVGSRNIQLYVLSKDCKAKPKEAYQTTIFGVTSGDVRAVGKDPVEVVIFQRIKENAPIKTENDDLRFIVVDAVEQFRAELRTSDAGWQIADYGAARAPNPFFDISDSCAINYAMNLKIGYYDFIRSVIDYNTYSYSVLPKEGSLPVVSDISSRYEYSSPGGAFDGFLGFGLKSTELRSYLTTFGDVARRAGEAETVLADEDSSAETETRDERFSPIVGWIIDPGAKAPAARTTGSFVTLNESILAIISVPAWWTEVRLAFKKEWIEGSGTVVPAQANERGDGNGLRELTVRLPNRAELIDSLLLDSARSGPVISEIDTAAKQTCDEVPLLIVGQRLWRNTAVTVGSVKARRIEVMPNMGGVVAYFGKPFSAERDERVRLWTSEGVTEATLTSPIVSRDAPECETQTVQQ